MLSKRALWGAHRVKFRVVAARIRAEVEDGVPIKQVWRKFEQSEIPGISYRQFLRYVSRMMETGSHLPKPFPGSQESPAQHPDRQAPVSPATTQTGRSVMDEDARQRKMDELMRHYSGYQPKAPPRIPNLDELVGKGKG